MTFAQVQAAPSSKAHKTAKRRPRRRWRPPRITARQVRRGRLWRFFEIPPPVHPNVHTGHPCTCRRIRVVAVRRGRHPIRFDASKRLGGRTASANAEGSSIWWTRSRYSRGTLSHCFCRQSDVPDWHRGKGGWSPADGWVRPHHGVDGRNGFPRRGDRVHCGVDPLKISSRYAGH